MQGSIQKRTGKRGTTWTVVVDLPRDPLTGKRRQKRVSAPTKRELEAQLAKTLHEVQSGSYVEPSRLTVAEFLDKWLAETAATVRPSTLDRYRRIIRLHILPTLGATPLPRLSALDVQALYRATLAAGAAPGTVRLHHAVLRKALDQAVRWRLLTVNPCGAVDPPRAGHTERQTWDGAQARAFLTVTDADERHGAFFRLALLTGMRRGELLALRWADVDLDRGVLAVKRTVAPDGAGGWTENEPKSASGRRQIALPPSAVAALRRHRARQVERRLAIGPVWEDADRVFERGDGRAIHPNAVDPELRRLATTAQLPRIRVHDLRHTAATLMLAQGVHPKIVAERLGHSTIVMTLDRYSHVSLDMQRDAANGLDEALGA